MLLAIFLWAITTGCYSLAYIPEAKDNFMSGVFLREIVNHMGKDLPVDLAYVDFQDSRTGGPGAGLPLGVRSLAGRDLEEEQLYPVDYDGSTSGDQQQQGGSGNSPQRSHPSIRDQEFLEHSSLYGSQYVSGGAGEGKQRLRPEGTLPNRQEVKTDATLPAYCNPPNPCPVGFTAEQGCIEEFENTASYSRRYQAAQDCMCDTEHMFDCPNPNVDSMDVDNDIVDNFNDMDFNRFLQRTMQLNPGLQHKNLVAKKYHQYNQHAHQKTNANPFLTGERLPVAAKKGNNVAF